jgi:hypothetical protein
MQDGRIVISFAMEKPNGYLIRMRNGYDRIDDGEKKKKGSSFVNIFIKRELFPKQGYEGWVRCGGRK